MFTEKSRYKNTEQYAVNDQRGRTVQVVAIPDPPQQKFRGYHLLKQGQRIDHLAAQYTGDETGFWRIAHANDAMLPDAISEQSEIAIPEK